jgi:hypothetical protein
MKRKDLSRPFARMFSTHHTWLVYLCHVCSANVGWELDDSKVSLLSSKKYDFLMG